MGSIGTLTERRAMTFQTRALCTVSALALTTYAALGAHAAFAQDQNAQTELEEVTVTGSRIVRDGYQAPTPLSVIDSAALESTSASNVAEFVNTMPVFSGSQMPNTAQGSVSAGTSGVNSLNLRNLGATRSLVLIDGQRSVGSLTTGVVDINTFPQQLIQRVEVVTGGASAVYGSDAVSGVVNFIIDKQFTGVKGEVSGGVTSYGDDKNYKIGLSAGFGFGGGRGHVLLSGEQVDRSGILDDGDRAWNEVGWGIMTNPLYGNPTAACPACSTSVPQRLLLPSVSESNAAPGGIIVSGPLKGTAFGPGGVPFQLNYGSIVLDPKMSGGDWKFTESRQNHGNSLSPSESRQNAFMRVAYDITDSINIFASAGWAREKPYTRSFTQFQLGNAGTIKADNAFIPAELRARMTALGLTTFALGSMNYDLPIVAVSNDRKVNRYVVGGNGKFDAFGTGWSWDAYFQNGVSRSNINAIGVASKSRFALAIDAVRNANGQIVCRSTLTNPNNGCVPWNEMGIGVNTDAARAYLTGTAHINQKLTQNVWAGSVTGEPFSNWAGPVSIALSAEHRSEKSTGVNDPVSQAVDWFAGNYLPVIGGVTVTEGALETVVPIAKGQPWADSWDLNAAVRATDYSTAGYVTTWKIGTTYTPIPDIKLRVTRSRDIRAPNLQELFAGGTSNQVTVFDAVTNTSPLVRGVVTGNTKLKPEKADTTGIGVVLQPSFLSGFSASVDYWNIDIKGSIGTIGAQGVFDLCVQGAQQFCQAITRVNGVATGYLAAPFNLSVQKARGLDLEASYRMPVSDLVSGWAGDVSLHGNATHYMKNFTDNGINKPTDTAGQNTSGGPPSWRMSATLAYDNNPIKASLTARAISGGTYDNSYITCTSGCPVSAVDNTTININHMAGAFYLDTSLSYKFGISESAEGEAFLNVKNIANRDPAAFAPFNTSFYLLLANATLYDTMGRVFRAGLRFKM